MRKACVVISIIGVICLGIFLEFYFSRPSVLFLTDDIPSGYLRNLDKPSFLTFDYRCASRNSSRPGKIESYDMVIDMTLGGIGNGENIYRPEYDMAELFLPLVDMTGDRDVFVLYDEDDANEKNCFEEMRGKRLGITGLPYHGVISRTEYDMLSDAFREGSYLFVFDTLQCHDFLRWLSKDYALVTGYLDAAALNEKPEIVASPAWDDMITSFLSI